MTASKIGPTHLESTDLGLDIRSSFSGWLLGKLSGRVLALWVADRIESSPRLKGAPQTLDGLAGLDLLSGAILSSAKRAESVFETWFNIACLEAVRRAYEFMSVPIPRSTFGFDYGKLNTSFRRLSLRSRWASTMSSPRPDDGSLVDLVSLHISMEIIRAHLNSISVVERSEVPLPISLRDDTILSEMVIVQSEVDPLSMSDIASFNAAMEEYVINLMKLKSAGLERLAKLSKDGIYSVLGLSADATDAEIKRAYRTLAMQLHPDKGGNKELFQQLTEAYEKILETRGLSKPNDGEAEEPRDVPSAPESPVPSGGGPSQSAALDPDPMVRIIKAAEECLRNAKLASELTAKAVKSISAGADLTNPELKAQVVLFLKAVRVAGYACLDISSAALEAVKSLTVHQDVSVITSLASDVMNCGFDALNAAAKISGDPISLISMMSESAGKAVEAARISTQLAKALERVISREDIDQPSSGGTTVSEQASVVDEQTKQRLHNAELLKRLNADLIEQHRQLVTASEHPAPNEFARATLRDHINDCICETRQRFEANILIRSVEGIVDLFKERCDLFTSSDALAVSATPLGRLCKYLAMTDNQFVVALVDGEVVDVLSGLAALRNRSTAPPVIQGAVRQALDVGRLKQRAVVLGKGSRLSIET